MKMIDKLRTTGRTARMLDHAIRLAKERRAVYVVFDRETHGLLALHEAFVRNKVPEDLQPLGIKVETLASLGPRFDLRTRRTPGAHKNCAFLVDHHVLERKFDWVLAQIHEYDAELKDEEVSP